MSEHVNLAEQSSQIKDRRGRRRIQIGSLAYVDLDRSNGGLILNISEGGIAVQAAQILAEDLIPEMRFRLPKSEVWIKSAGKIVWQGKSRKEAGIQFVNLSEDNRLLIHDWIYSETFTPISPAEEDQSKNLQDAPEQTTENVRLNPISRSNPSELNAMFPSEKTPSSVEGLGTHQTSFPDVGPKAASPKTSRPVGPTELPSKSPTIQSTKVHSEGSFAVNPATNSGSAELANPIASEAVKDTKNSEGQSPAMTPVEILRQAMTPRVERPEARHTTEKHAGKGIPNVPVLNTRFPSEALQHERQPIAPNPIHIEVPTRGYWRPFSGYEAQPETPSRKRSILTSILCFAAGLGLAFLIMRGSWSLKNILFQPEHPSVADSTTSGRQPEPSDETASPNTETQPASPDDLAQQTPAPSSDIPTQTVSPSASGGGVMPSVTPRSSQGKSEGTVAHSGSGAGQHQIQGSNITSSKGQSTDASGLDNTATPPQNERTLDAYGQENRKVPTTSNNVSQGTEPVQAPQTSGTDKNRTGLPVSQGTTAVGTVAIRSHFNSVRNAPAPDSDSSSSTLQIGQLTSIRQPVYPPEAARRRIEGTVRLQAVVAENGVVETIKLLSGPPGLVAPAINAVQDWRYGPTFLDGHPIESIEDVTVEFRLANSTPSPR